MKTITFRDRAKIYVSSGNGGNGICSFRREKFVPNGGPDGGDGGRGGHVHIRAVMNIDSLLPLYYNPHQRAGNGGHGRGARCHGKNGADLCIEVPCGTTITDVETGEFFGEVLHEGEEIMLARGGKGGIGNWHFKSSTHQAPREFTCGEEGETRTLQLELKLVADVALVGYPNAGKSTLVSRLSHARPKIASYPFTTLNPVIGTVIFDDFTRLRVADIPGLIDGAHDGIGLGHDFLRHIERTHFLLFVIDMAGVDGRDPSEDYFHLREEVRLYRPELDQRPYLIIANKMDLPEAQENLAEFQRNTGSLPLAISADTADGVDAVKISLYDHFEK